jgi:MoaA/NifB/PqqE/SkfB family radical SAM enzyme
MVEKKASEDILRKIYVEPTTRCNLNCLTCVRNTWREPLGTMEWPVFEKLIEGLQDFPEARTMSFSGSGEPLLHPRFADMIRLAHERGLRTEVTSNGLLLTRKLVGELLDAGLDQFVVSIDGTGEHQGGVRPDAPPNTIIRNVKMFHRYYNRKVRPAVRIGISFVAMKRNIRYLPDLRQVATRVGASFILVSNFLPHEERLRDEVLYHVRATALENPGKPWAPLWMFPFMDWDDRTSEALAKVLRSQPNLSILNFNLNERKSYCPFIQGQSLSVAWNGIISPCLPLMHSYTCYVLGRKKELRAYGVGNLKEQNLSSLWNNPEYAAFRRRVYRFQFPACTDCSCHLQESNETDCDGNPFPVCGDCLWARGILRCA